MSSTIAPSSAPTAAATSPTSASALITSTGIGSGLDIGAIVSSLTTAYGAAQNAQLASQASSLDSQVSAYGTFTSALDKLQQALPALEDPSQLAGFDATVADKTIASATTTSDAVAGQPGDVGDPHIATVAGRLFDRGGHRNPDDCRRRLRRHDQHRFHR
jgi:flagellar hook-associated protein 2